jgi:hypothetical protein
MSVVAMETKTKELDKSAIQTQQKLFSIIYFSIIFNVSEWGNMSIHGLLFQ